MEDEKEPALYRGRRMAFQTLRTAKAKVKGQERAHGAQETGQRLVEVVGKETYR